MCKLILFIILLPQLPWADSLDITGKFTFDWLSPQTSRCQKIDVALNKKLATFKCISSEGLGGEEQPPLYTCKSKNEKQEYLVYESAADCRAARQAVLATPGE